MPGSFRHVGLESTRGEVDAGAFMSGGEGIVKNPAKQMPPPIGCICSVEDSDGDTIDLSHQQTKSPVWGEGWGSGP